MCSLQLNFKPKCIFNDLEELSTNSFFQEENALHVLILSENRKQPVQVLFTGDRMLQLNVLKNKIGQDNLEVDHKFYDSSLYTKPMTQEQGCMTLIDESLMHKSGVWINNNGENRFVSTDKLLEIYPNARVGEYSIARKNKTLNQSSPAIAINLNNLLINLIAKAPQVTMFKASRDELIALRVISDYCEHDLSDILELDFSLFAHFCDFYVSTIGINADLSLPINEIILSLGKKTALNYLVGLALADSTNLVNESNIDVYGEQAKMQLYLSALMKNIASEIRNEYTDKSVQLAENLGRLYSYPFVVWNSYFSDVNEIDELSLCNPHCELSEIQEYIAGFNANDLASIFMKANGYPKSIIQLITNNKELDDGFYSSIMKFSLINLEKKLLIKKQPYKETDFSGDFSEALSKSDKLQSLLDIEIKKINLVAWRYESNVVKLHNKNSVDRQYYFYQS